MNDFDFDCAQKKRIARGAFNRKGTTNRKGCRLPHENLTKKELEKLNGEIRTVCMTSPVSWPIFKELAPDLQEEYLDTQIRRFGVGLTTIGRELFGLKGSDSMLANYVRDHNLSIISAPPGRQPKAALDSWKRWLKTGVELVEDDDPFEETEEEHAEFERLKSEGIASRSEPTGIKPFRAHDYRAATQVTMCEEALRDAGLERDELTEDVPEIIYPLTGMNLELKGTPIDILATLRMSFPALLDKDKTYRFTIKADTFVISPPGKAL